MKKTMLSFTIILSLSIFMLSCKKTLGNTNQQTTTQTLKKNQSFKYDFGFIGIEDALSITQQARNFDISLLSKDDTGKMIYTYKPNLNFVGTDKVEITLNISNGATVIKNIKTMLKITITN